MQPMSPVPNQTSNAQRPSHRLYALRAELRVARLNLVLHALDRGEVAHGLDAKLERRVAVGDDERPGVMLQCAERPLHKR